LDEETGDEGLVMTNTTIGVVATNMALTKEEANFLAQTSHNGIALSIRPSHTMRDGDTMFAMATGRSDKRVDITALGAAAVTVISKAILRAVSCATGLGGVPAVSELPSE
jgi:L-aminopeptidase/D-esterase-like protein